jgi:hypothetical protein
MAHPIRVLPLAALALLAACGVKRNLSAEVRECSAISLDAKGTAQCLVQLHRWEPAKARLAADARHRELDSLKTWHDDSVWGLDPERHRRDVATCGRGADPLDRCLLMAGWPLGRVTSTIDSLWQHDAAAHRQEIQTCQSRRDVNLASCLTLYYKWDNERALQTADSITRERLGGAARR